jgi:hypothetical protein
MGKPDKNMSLGKRRCRWEDNIKVSLQEVGWGTRNVLLWLRIKYSWRALVNAAMNIRVP